MKRLFPTLTAVLLAIAPLLTSCSESDEDNTTNEFTNWRQRNEAYFASVRSDALSQIARAKAAYGDDWQENCEWCAYLNFARSAAGTNNTAQDSIFVQILKRGTGSGCPLSTDNVRVFYAGRLMPTDIHPNGLMFSHSGQSTLLDKIFERTTAVPTTFAVNDLTRGFATAVQHMHIGDRWRIYVPAKLGYNNAERTDVPAYSTLVFDVELVQYARSGASLPDWN